MTFDRKLEEGGINTKIDHLLIPYGARRNEIKYYQMEKEKIPFDIIEAARLPFLKRWRTNLPKET